MCLFRFGDLVRALLFTIFTFVVLFASLTPAAPFTYLNQFTNYMSGKSKVSRIPLDKEELNKLPISVQRWLDFETLYMNRSVDPRWFKNTSAENNNQDPFYSPESRNI